jgi:hypothetical protein
MSLFILMLVPTFAKEYNPLDLLKIVKGEFLYFSKVENL